MAQVKPCSCQPFAHTHVDGPPPVVVMVANEPIRSEVLTFVPEFVPEDKPARASREPKAEPASVLDDPAQKAEES